MPSNTSPARQMSWSMHSASYRRCRVPHSHPQSAQNSSDSCEYVLFTERLNDGVMLAKQLAVFTAKDENLTKVKKRVYENWHIRIAREDVRLKPYFDRKDEMSVSHGLLYWGHRMVAPKKAKTTMLQLLHDKHQ